MVACEGDEGIRRDYGADYFPVETGMYRIFDVEETRYALGMAPEVVRYELMAVVVDSFPSDDDRITFVIHRSTRADDTKAWEPLNTWSVRSDEERVVVSEGNVPFVKLVFPLAAKAHWDGNAFNTLGPDEYLITSVDQIAEVNGTTFEHTVTVEQERNLDAVVFRDVRTEMYARGVGLIYRESIQLEYCTDDSCLGQQKVEQGLARKITIKEYGKH